MTESLDDRFCQLTDVDPILLDFLRELSQRVSTFESGTGNIPEDDSVSTDKVQDGAIIESKIAANNVTLPLLGIDVLAYFPGTPDFTVGTEAADVINVLVQLKDVNGSNISGEQVVRAWLSDTAGAAVTGTTPNGGLTVGSYGTMVEEPTADRTMVVVTDSSGKFDLNINHTLAQTWYLNIDFQGRLHTSGAITFA